MVVSRTHGKLFSETSGANPITKVSVKKLRSLVESSTNSQCQPVCVVGALHWSPGCVVRTCLTSHSGSSSCWEAVAVGHQHPRVTFYTRIKCVPQGIPRIHLWSSGLTLPLKPTCGTHGHSAGAHCSAQPVDSEQLVRGHDSILFRSNENKPAVYETKG